MTTNTNKHSNQEIVDFFADILSPTGDDLVESHAYSLMSQYLTQIEQTLKEQKMTKKQLASEIGTSASYLSQFFNLNKVINLKTLAKIELALDIGFHLKPQHEEFGVLPSNIGKRDALLGVNLNKYTKREYAVVDADKYQAVA